MTKEEHDRNHHEYHNKAARMMADVLVTIGVPCIDVGYECGFCGRWIRRDVREL